MQSDTKNRNNSFAFDVNYIGTRKVFSNYYEIDTWKKYFIFFMYRYL